jgi:acyl-CoA synthetase (AMP-forming)/AMP-acid ligase II
VSAASLADLLFDAEAMSSPFVHAAGETHTRQQVADRASELAATLSALDLARGAPVGVMLPDGMDVVAALFGVWKAGTVYVPLNPRLGTEDLTHIIDSVGLAAVITTSASRERFEGPAVVTVDRPGPTPSPGVTAGRTYDEDVALIQLTSGTTGRPKPVMLLHDGVLELIDGVLAKLRGGGARPSADPMPNLIPVSLSLWAGIYNVLFAARAGAPVVLMDGFDVHQFAALVDQFQIRSTVLPPAAMTMLADAEDITDLSPLRFVRSITAPLSPLQARRFRDRFGIAVLNSYGQTEIGGEIVGWNAADSRAFGDEKIGSVGRPHVGVEVRARDEQGADVATGEPGELIVRTPALSGGYADGSDLADRLTPDGFFRTGDIGRVDADGFVWIEGRLSDMVNRGGLKVFPGEVEEVLRLLASIDDAAVVGLPDQRLGEVPVAVVVSSSGEQPMDADVATHCRAHLAAYKVPVSFHWVDALPRNEVGKVLKAELVRDLASRAT